MQELEKSVAATGPLPESGVETSDTAIQAIQQQTKEAVDGALEIVEGNGVIANTIGHIFALPTHLILGTWKDIFKSTPTKELREHVENRFKDVKWKGDTMVRLGHNNLAGQLFRLFKPGIKNRPHMLLRLLIGLPTTIFTSIASGIGRMDHYNPWTKTAVVYHPDKAVVSHELGHAVDYDKSDYPGLYSLLYGLPMVNLYHEWKASNIAMKHLSSEERGEAAKVLEPAYGSYVGGGLGALFPKYFNPLYIGSVIAGHIHARTSNKLDKRNWFFSEKSEERKSLDWGADQIPAVA